MHEYKYMLITVVLIRKEINNFIKIYGKSAYSRKITSSNINYI